MAFRRGRWAAAIVLLVATGAAGQSTGSAAPNSPATIPASADRATAARGVSPPDAPGGKTPASGLASTSPASKPVRSTMADRSLPPRSDQENRTLGAGPPPGDPIGWWRTLGALALVVALILAMRWLLRRSSSVRASSRMPQAIEVMAKTAVSPKHTVMLVRVGRRVLVVAAGADGMNTLAEIQDPEQVSELLGDVQRGKANSLSGSFAKALGGWRNQMTEAGEPVETVGVGPLTTPAAGAADRIKSMLEKIRRVGSNLGRRQ